MGTPVTAAGLPGGGGAPAHSVPAAAVGHASAAPNGAWSPVIEDDLDVPEFLRS
jgi:hypothetical protein